MSETNIKIPEKMMFFLQEQKRYKVAYGGRGCIDGESMLETPQGNIKIKDFQGGKIYTYNGSEKIIAYACKPIKYPKDNMYQVITENNKSVIVNKKHKFLTQRGWVRCEDLTLSDYLVCDDIPLEFSNPQATSSGGDLLECRVNAQHYFYKLLNYLYYYWQDFHQYDEQLQLGVKTYQDVLQQLTDELLHKNRVSNQKDDWDISYISDLIYQFLFHLSNFAFALSDGDKNFEEQENYICEKSSELLSVSYRLSRLFDEKKAPYLLVQQLSKQLLYLYNELNQDENLKTIFDILSYEFENNPFSDSFNIVCKHNHHYNKILDKVKSIKYCKYDNYYDLFIPIYNCYFANGILHHNSGKSYNIGISLVVKILQEPLRILCTRQFQTSIRDSVHKLLSDIIEKYGLLQYFTITRDNIKCYNGGEFLFRGIQNNINEIKSMEGVDIAWCEEAQNISQESWDILIPTIRKEGSEIWITFNPDRDEDATYTMFVKNKRDDCHSELVNYVDNPFFPEVLRREMEYCKKVDFGKYENVWLGKTTINTEAQVFKGKFELKDFDTPDDARFFFGVDWGFACLSGDTMITTDKGDIKLKDIRIGDRVLTRNGYKRVLLNKNKGIKKVYRVEFDCGYKTSIIATDDHRIYTADGWKQVKELKDKETLCLIKLNLMGRFIKGIQQASIRIISIINGKKTGNITKQSCIGIYMNTIKEKFQQGILYITKTITHLTTPLKTLCVSLQENILRYIIVKNLDQYQKKEQKKSEQKMDIQKKTGKKEELNLLQQLKKNIITAWNVVKNSKLLMCIKNIAVQIVEKEQIQELVKKSISVKYVVKDLWHHLIYLEKPVLQNVLINSHYLEEREVYDLTIEEDHEYFANGILVHNCDPTTLVRCFMKDRCLYIDQEAYGVGVELDEIPQLFDSVPESRKWKILADCARPETVSHIKNKGFNIESCPKWKGSVEDGVEYIRSFEKVYIHPRCSHTYHEFKFYSYKQDKNTGEVLPILLDKDNHIIDSIRYALNSYIQKDISILDVL